MVGRPVQRGGRALLAASARRSNQRPRMGERPATPNRGVPPPSRASYRPSAGSGTLPEVSRLWVMRTLFLSCICCAIPFWATAGERVQSLIELREQHVVVQKWDTSCGAAALATVLNFEHGDAVGEREVAATMLRQTGVLK